jgi:hypothetical protein
VENPGKPKKTVNPPSKYFELPAPTSGKKKNVD